MAAFAADAADYLRDAQAYFDKAEYSAAVIQLKNALLAEPDNAEARLLLGRTYLELKDGLSAAKELSRAQDLGVTRETVLVLLGRAWLMSGQYDKVLQGITQESGDSPELAIDILVLQGQAYLATRKPAMAEEKFDRALALKPASVEALLGQARTAFQNQDTSVANGLVNKALALEPDNTDALILKGELLRLAGQPKDAAAAFQKALEIDAGSLPARLGHATALLTLGEPDTALVDIDYVLEKHPDLFLAHYLKALTQFQQRQLEPARASVQRALKQAPGYPPGHLLAGTLAYHQGQLNQAEDHLRTFWNHDPGNQQAALLLGATLLKLKAPNKVIEVLEPGASSASDNAQYLSLLGSAYLANGDAGKGLEYLERAAILAPDAAGVHAQLAIGQLIQGDTDQAVSQLQSAVELDPDLVQADVLLVLSQLHKQDFESALTSIAVLAEKMPDSPVPFNLKGAALLGKGDHASAKSAFEAALTLQPEFLPAHLNLAQLELMDGNTAVAETRYKTVLSYDEGNLKALVALATLANRRGDGKESEQWLQQARTHHPQVVEPALLLLAHYLRQDRQERALDIARDLVVAHPGNQLVLRAVAQTHVQAGDYETVVRTLRSLVEVSPQSAEAHYLLGMAQLKLDQTGDARISLSQAIELQTDYPAAQLALARMDISEKDYDAALSLAAALEQVHPDASFADELRGDMAAARKAPKDAAEAYALAYEKTASAQLARKLYQSRIQAGDTESALAVLERWLDAHPEDVSNRSLFAQALIGAGRHPQAIDEYLVVLEHSPANVSALNNIAWLYQEQGIYPEGVKYAERAYQQVPNRPEVIDTLGWLLVLNGETNRGLVLLQEARSKAPHIPDIHYHLAVALERAGRKDEARKELNRLLKSSKEFPERDKAEALQDKLGG